MDEVKPTMEDVKPTMEDVKPSNRGELGMAPIKQEFLVPNQERVINWEYVADDLKESEGASNKRKQTDDRDNPKKLRLKGQNKNRRRFNQRMRGPYKGNKRDDDEDQADEPPPQVRPDPSTKMCLKYLETDGNCQYGDNCKFSHDLFKMYKELNSESLDLPCYLYTTYGRCSYSFACRFNKSHVNVNEAEEKVINTVDEAKWSSCTQEYTQRERNRLSIAAQQSLRKKRFDFSLAEAAVKQMYIADNRKVETEDDDDINEEKKSGINKEEKRIGAVVVNDFIKSRDIQKKRVDFKDKLILAPLTTVGNLPFRRLCKKFSCDITCAEMSLSSSILTGNPSEWSHVRRHASEDVFGVQICGQYPETMTKTALLLKDQCDFDFLDINCGCPIDWIYMSGQGAGIMLRPSKMRKVIAGCCMVSDVPVTIKMRTGPLEEKNIAHNIIRSIIEPFGKENIGGIFIHGRSRAQRYTKLADWNYIDECAKVSGDIPLIGSGDCISMEQYYENMEKYTNVHGVMIARGALMKPWIFTEIKEKRTWDITSSERLSYIQDYANFGLDHWGSDAQGVETTRRFLLEWLSFACRYIPAGLLEVLPQRINDRAPAFKGRDEMETLLSSNSCSDWVKISEMFLGKVPEEFSFIPKHKASATDLKETSG